MQALGALVASYGQLSTEETQAFAASATVAEGEGDLSGTVRIRGGAIKQPGDEMTVWIDPQTFMMRRLQISTFYEDNEVSLTAEFGSVADGPTYQARSILLYPERELELVMRDFHHEKFQVLISSMIIENGLDIPTVNTIIINRADTFGQRLDVETGSTNYNR